MKKILLFGLLLSTLQIFAQNQVEHYFKLNRQGFQAEQAYQTTAFVEQFFRVPGNTGFNESIYRIEKILKEAGYVLEKENEFEAPLTYRIERRSMNRNTWEPVDASIFIEGESVPLQSFKTNRNMIPINCPSTPAEGVLAEVVYVNKGTPADFEGKDLKGKIVFAEQGATRILNAAIKAGAIGTLGHSMPAYTQASKHQSSIQFTSMNGNLGAWALLLSYASKERLKEACAKGPVRLRVKIETKSYSAEELTIVANVRGEKKAQERFVFSAHVQEPGANDNASGVGALAEMARLTAQLVKSNAFRPDRSLTFLWGDEITSTRRYIVENKERAAGILWGMSLDMVGEDTDKTGGTFLLEKMPDPSAIWTRGEDKHSEWGAGNVQEKDLFPHYFNDFVFDICKAQGQFANWTVKFNPFEGGSDHTPFLQNKIPGLLMWHFTDVFYHTDNDRLDKVSATTLKNVGISALTAAMTLVSANEKTHLAMLNDLKANADMRLKTEFNLSQKAVEANSDKNAELHILKSWTNWYLKAFDSIKDLPIDANTKKLDKAIIKAKNAFEKTSLQYQKML